MDGYSTLQALCLTNSAIRNLTLPVLYENLIIFDWGHLDYGPHTHALPAAHNLLDNIISKGYYRYIRTIYYSWLMRDQEDDLPMYIEEIGSLSAVIASQDLFEHFLRFLQQLSDCGKKSLDVLAIYRTACIPADGICEIAEDKAGLRLSGPPGLHIHKVYCTYPQIFPCFYKFITTPHLWLYETIKGESWRDYHEDNCSDSEEDAEPQHCHSVLSLDRYLYPARTSLKTFGMSYIGNQEKRAAVKALYSLIQAFGGPPLSLETGREEYCEDLEIFAVYDRIELSLEVIEQFHERSGPIFQVCLLLFLILMHC